jgi:hypothetical protein
MLGGSFIIFFERGLVNFDALCLNYGPNLPTVNVV